MTVVAASHVPAPSQVRAWVSVEPVQDAAAPQTVPARVKLTSSGAVAGAVRPARLVRPASVHWLSGSVPTATGVQVPLVARSGRTTCRCRCRRCCSRRPGRSDRSRSPSPRCKRFRRLLRAASPDTEVPRRAVGVGRAGRLATPRWCHRRRRCRTRSFRPEQVPAPSHLPAAVAVPEVQLLVPQTVPDGVELAAAAAVAEAVGLAARGQLIRALGKRVLTGGNVDAGPGAAGDRARLAGAGAGGRRSRRPAHSGSTCSRRPRRSWRRAA